MLSFVFLSQPIPATASPSSLLSLLTLPSNPSLDYQPISVLLHSLHSLLLFARDNTLVVFLFLLVTSTVLWLLGFNLLISPASLTAFFRTTLGVSLQRTKRAVSELKRKSFHLLGLLIPVIYYMGSKYAPLWLNQHRAVLIMGLCTAVVWLVEAMRLWWPAFRRGYSRIFAPLLRKKEMTEDNVRLTGVGYFFLGNFLCVFLFEPTIATCASLYLVLGDMTAAIIGISYGRLRLPWWGKSVEGSVAMWLMCLLVGTVVFWHVRLSEYPVVVGATVATLSELMLGGVIDDNLCIPLCSALALHLSFQRIGQSPPLP